MSILGADRFFAVAGLHKRGMTVAMRGYNL
jgi:hypothetical protein